MSNYPDGVVESMIPGCTAKDQFIDRYVELYNDDHALFQDFIDHLEGGEPMSSVSAGLMVELLNYTEINREWEDWLEQEALDAWNHGERDV